VLRIVRSGEVRNVVNPVDYIRDGAIQRRGAQVSSRNESNFSKGLAGHRYAEAYGVSRAYLNTAEFPQVSIGYL